MKKRNYKWQCPVCRALNCKYNENDVCIRDDASEIPGYRCPYFENRDSKKSSMRKAPAIRY